MERIKNLPFALLIAGIGAASSGCASLDKSECEYADWHQMGLEDGANGRSKSRIQEYAADCGEFGIQPNREQYNSGWEVGIVKFCTPENGFRKGVSGYTAGTSCPAESIEDFYSGYTAGKNIHEKQSRVDNLERKLKTLDNDLDDSDASAADEKRAREKRKDLERELRDASFELGEAKGEARGQGFSVQ